MKTRKSKTTPTVQGNGCCSPMVSSDTPGCCTPESLVGIDTQCCASELHTEAESRVARGEKCC